MQRFLRKIKRKSLVTSEIRYVWGGLIERWAYLKFWLRGEGLIRERGLNRAFTAVIEFLKSLVPLKLISYKLVSCKMRICTRTKVLP